VCSTRDVCAVHAASLSLSVSLSHTHTRSLALARSLTLSLSFALGRQGDVAVFDEVRVPRAHTLTSQNLFFN